MQSVFQVYLLLLFLSLLLVIIITVYIYLVTLHISTFDGQITVADGIPAMVFLGIVKVEVSHL